MVQTSDREIRSASGVLVCLILRLRVLSDQLCVYRSVGLLQRNFFAIDALDELEIVSLQSLARSDVEARLKNRIDRFIKLFARLFALVVFEVELALAEMILRAVIICVTRGSDCSTSVGIARADEAAGICA